MVFTDIARGITFAFVKKKWGKMKEGKLRKKKKKKSWQDEAMKGKRMFGKTSRKRRKDNEERWKTKKWEVIKKIESRVGGSKQSIKERDRREKIEKMVLRKLRQDFSR